MGKFIVNILTHPIFTLILGIIVGFYLRIQSDRLKLLRQAGANLAAEINREILTLMTRKRPDGVTNWIAIDALQIAASQYRSFLTVGLARRRFERQWKDYEKQINKKYLHSTPDPNFEPFGYYNYLEAAKALKNVLAVVK